MLSSEFQLGGQLLRGSDIAYWSAVRLLQLHYIGETFQWGGSAQNVGL